MPFNFADFYWYSFCFNNVWSKSQNDIEEPHKNSCFNILFNNYVFNTCPIIRKQKDEIYMNIKLQDKS